MKLHLMIERAKRLHRIEHKITVESVLLVGELEKQNASGYMNMSKEQFATLIGLSCNMYWKRAQAARVIEGFPEFLPLLISGETNVSHLSLLSPKITNANAELLFSGIRNKSKREVEAFVSRVTLDGKLKDEEGQIDVHLCFSESEMKELDRAREVASHSGKMPRLKDLLMKTVREFVKNKDPMQKAQRAAQIRKRSRPTSPGKPASSRPKIPAATIHELWIRDGGQCTWRLYDGSRCPERAMLEKDHYKRMWCRGGKDSLDNLTLRCRSHNQFSAKQQLGSAYFPQGNPRR